MKLKYMGKYSGDENSLPKREHPKNYIPFKEPNNMKKLAIILNVFSFVLIIALVFFVLLRTNFKLFEFKNNDSLIYYFLFAYGGILVSLLVIYPHELLHAICFKNEVYMYQNLKQGLMFVVGTEDMTKFRFIFMSLLPNIIFGFIPYIIFMIFPNLIFFGTLGAFSIGAGVGDYLNVINALFQVKKGGLIYMSGMHSYWYLPQNNLN